MPYLVSIILVWILSEILLCGQRIAEQRGKPRVMWIHIFFYILWGIIFLIYSSICVLCICVGISSFFENNINSAIRMLVIGAVLIFSIYLIFIRPILINLHKK